MREPGRHRLLVRISSIAEPRVNKPTFGVGVQVDERRREERVGEPQRPESSTPIDARLAKLVDAGTSDHAVEPPERRRRQAGLAGGS